MKKVSIYTKTMTIPTYGVGDYEKNPIFIEKRVYQGSSGKVYPNPIIEKISDTRIDVDYETVVLENDYIYVIVMPSLGGRIYTAYDKSNGYDFIYHNEVIKPALVGLLGPWISGGIEFNWPQHHRPSTFMPTSYKITEYPDGSASVFVGEIENMFGTKGMTEIKLYPDKAYIEINAQIYNRTDTPQTFLWWANPAVKVNDYTKTVMPPDVTAVMDHGKRAVSAFPIAQGEYYKMDYSKGVDISMYKNIPVPTSFMAYKSNFDFVGQYDSSIDAGIYHYADHHVSPGKKQWTWGCGEFGKAWDRHLTDSNGPYVELMTGCFTDNQPDFTFIAPQEEKTFTQYFMPYKHVGEIKNANKDFCLNIKDGVLTIYATGEFKDVAIQVTDNGIRVFADKQDFTPKSNYRVNIDCGMNAEVVIDYNGNRLTYSAAQVEKFDIPSPAIACPEPNDCATNEELYLYGMHIEQYRHATRRAEDYYLEGLKRDDTDARLNNAYGLLLFKRGEFGESIGYYQKAIDKLTCKNPNPYDTEPYYNLGLAYLYNGDSELAYDNFYKSIWGNHNKSAAFYFLAAIDTKRKNYDKALEHITNSLIFNVHNMKAISLKGIILNAMNDTDNAAEVYEIALKIDALDIIADYEYAIRQGKSAALLATARDTEIIDLSYDYIICGNYDRAISLIEEYFRLNNSDYPLLWYYKAYAEMMIGLDSQSSLDGALRNADKLCFAHRLSDIVVLSRIIEYNNNDYLANYYLGNIYYDKRRYDKAVSYWSRAAALNTIFPTVKRNLALYYYNKRRDPIKATELLERAFDLNKADGRIFMELDQLYKITGVSDETRLRFIQHNLAVAVGRDDEYIEYLTLLNNNGECERVEELLAMRNFHPWEGGEGKTSKLYKRNKIDLAKKYMNNGEGERAINKLLEGLNRPQNLGEGKLIMDGDNDIYYYLGEMSEQMGNKAAAVNYYKSATIGKASVADDMYYNDTPIDYIYYMAKAYHKLGNYDETARIKREFMKYYDTHINAQPVIDYFAVSLPDMLIWEQDAEEKNKEFCCKIKAMANTL